MAKNLVIVESPSKSKTIEKYLGKDFKVVSSKGHIRDLSNKGKFGLGVDIENDFTPDYVLLKGKKETVKELEKEAKKADHVYLATDPDREGEAISWHLYKVLGLNDNNYDRVVFNEITKNAVTKSFENPRKIDQDLVNSQATRQILDKIIGFRLSRLIQTKTNGTSAGRVQSVALKLIVEREREIEEFVPEESWTITAYFSDFDAELFNYNHKKIEIKDELTANSILDKLSNSFKIEESNKKDGKKDSKFPYTTSTLQQDASNKLGMSAKKTMSVAQKLYEGIELSDETVGLISYMRTDSTRLSDDFIISTNKFIETNYGKEYLGNVKASKKKDNVQDAHEAIRPTDINRTPESVKLFLSNDEYKLYKMIYYRALASLMASARTESSTVILDNNNYQFKATGQVITFDGYLKVYKDYEEVTEKDLSKYCDYNTGVLIANDKKKEQHFTKPPARYTEASLIKKMEELGIGRPSTYATTVDTLKSRGYADLKEKKFNPTKTGFDVTDKLQEYFDGIINVEYTANMETDLDKISEGNANWVNVLKEFYKEFEPTINNAFQNMEKLAPEKTGEDCPNCGSALVIRKGKFGEFTACSNYPECKYIKTEVKEIIGCPECSGKIIEKKSKKGKVFYGCNNYPKCNVAFWDKPIEEKCPECNSLLTIKGKKVKCSKCDYVKFGEI